MKVLYLIGTILTLISILNFAEIDGPDSEPVGLDNLENIC